MLRMFEGEIRWYQGKFKVKILRKSEDNYLVEALEDIKINVFGGLSKGAEFETVPRLLWRRKK